MLTTTSRFGDTRLPDRFWSKVKVNPQTGCWEWQRRLTFGYGYYSVGAGVAHRAHRVAYQTLVGPVPSGLCLDHLCRVRCCVNPSHLEPVTWRENTLRGDTHPARNAAKTACDHGHELLPPNLYITPNGRRQCRMCRAEASRAWRARRRVRDQAYGADA